MRSAMKGRHPFHPPRDTCPAASLLALVPRVWRRLQEIRFVSIVSLPVACPDGARAEIRLKLGVQHLVPPGTRCCPTSGPQTKCAAVPEATGFEEAKGEVGLSLRLVPAHHPLRSRLSRRHHQEERVGAASRPGRIGYCSGASPSCCRRLRVSNRSQNSTILLSSKRCMARPSSSICLPVGGPSPLVSP
jgi:hypothetical protein